jgi:peptidoglycan/LPS O-acetylase OafA/YrhL
MESVVGGEVPGVHIRPGVDKPHRVLRSAIIFLCLAGLVLAYVTAASHAPWPVEGPAAFVWGAGLVAVAVGYVLKNRNELSPAGVRWGLALAIVGFFLPIVLNQCLNSDYLHRLHKLLAFVSASVVFVAWVAALKYRTRRRASTG